MTAENLQDSDRFPGARHAGTGPPPEISVIIVNRNTADLLVRCLGHVYESAQDFPTQVIVVDNGSTDDSVARVRSEYPGAAILEAGRNLGFAAANNLGLEIAYGEFVLLVNTDAMLDRECVPKLVELMTNDPQIGMAGPQLLNDDRTPQTSYEAVPTLATETLNRSLLKRLFPSRFPDKRRALTEPEPVEALIGAVMIARRDALVALEGFDEGYFFFLEETDLAVRMRDAGWKVVHEPRAYAVHLQGATAKTYRTEARIEFYRSRYRFFSKHYGLISTMFLRSALAANLLLNILVLGPANVVTFGFVKDLRGRFMVRYGLWKWHIQGCPDGPGLPRD